MCTCSVLVARQACTQVTSAHENGATSNGATSNGAVDKEYDYDLFTIGAGSGGVRGTRFAAQNYGTPAACSRAADLRARTWLTSCALPGARAAICELPFDKISSDTKGGAGGEFNVSCACWISDQRTAAEALSPHAGTCVLRGCVPKKLMVIGGEFSSSFRDSKAFG